MKVAAKVQAKISVRNFTCGSGKVPAEGKQAKAPFCYRIKVERKRIQQPDSMLKGRVSVIELHSRITGRKIGYIGMVPGSIVARKSDANRFVEGQHDRSLKPFDTPELVDKKMQRFIRFAQDPSSEPLVTPGFQKAAAKTWKTLLREARKP